MANNLDFIVRVIDKFSGPMKAFDSALSFAAKGVAAVGASAVAAGAGLLEITRRVANSTDAVGKFALRIGVSTEALSAYQHAAELSGVSNEQLNLSWQRMSRRVSEAAQGTGEAQGALEELNLSAKELAQLSPDQQFQAVAGALESVGSQSDKVRLAFKLFDAEGVGVLQMLEGGAEGLAAMTSEAEKFGLVVSQQAAANSAMFNDNLTRLTGSIEGVARAVSNKLMPFLSGGMGRLSTLLADNREKIVAFAVDGGRKFVNFVADLARGVAFIIDVFHDWELTVANMNILFSEFGISVLETVEDITDSTVDMLKAINVNDAFAPMIAKAESAGSMVGRAIRDLRLNVLEEEEFIQESLKRGFAMDEIEAQIAQARSLIDDLGAEGAGTVEDGGEASGSGEGTDANVQATAANLAELQAMHDEMFLTNVEREDLWYEGQLERYAGNQEALDQLNEIHVKKRSDAEIKDADATAKAKADVDKKYAGFKANLDNNLATITKALGKKTFAAFQKAQYAMSFIDAIRASVRAFSDYPFPASLGVATLAFTSALASAAKIKAVGSAHGGLDNVPETGTYVLQRNERVLSADQNREITNFVQQSQRTEDVGTGAGVTNVFNIGTIQTNDPDDLVRQAAIHQRNAERDGVNLGQENFAIG